MSKLRATEIVGIMLFCTGASTVDTNQFVGALMVLAGLGIFVLEAKKEGIPLPKLNLALNGNRRLTLEEYTAICAALDVSVDKFLKSRVPEK